jgi:high-affinity nickel-transport protein
MCNRCHDRIRSGGREVTTSCYTAEVSAWSADVPSAVSAFSVMVLGFSLGVRHATDADHVVAVATIVARERSLRGAALLGSLWGVGHTLTILLVGGAVVLFGVVIPPRVGLGMELSVAVMLVLLGGLNLSGVARSARAMAEHDPAEGPHEHGDGALGRLDRRLGHLGAYQVARPLVVGVVHGLAGSAAVALLVLGTIRSPAWAVGYLLVFGAGTIAGMMLITTALAMPFAYTARRFARVNRRLALISGLLSLAFGAFLVYHIGVVDGLFTAHPRWTPG